MTSVFTASRAAFSTQSAGARFDGFAFQALVILVGSIAGIAYTNHVCNSKKKEEWEESARIFVSDEARYLSRAFEAAAESSSLLRTATPDAAATLPREALEDALLRYLRPDATAQGERLVVGPEGAGKSTAVRKAIRAALRGGDGGIY
jgi:hypothetical protein